jgi:hypothetical protein
MVGGLFTRSASILGVTLAGLAGWGVTELAIQSRRLMRRRVTATVSATGTIPAQAAGESQPLRS